MKINRLGQTCKYEPILWTFGPSNATYFLPIIDYLLTEVAAKVDLYCSKPKGG